MSKVLVIPDTHLKSKMFDLADKIMQEYEVDYVVQLGDNLDDFYCYDGQYRDHNVRMLAFYHDHPNTIWLWGNHEISYILNSPVTGNIRIGKEYAYIYRENFNPKFVHLDDKVVFSHAGIFQEFLDNNKLNNYKTVEELIEEINQQNLSVFWQNESPIWARPQHNRLISPDLLNGYLQIVGHTPTEDIFKENNIVSVDVFSTHWGKKIGVEKMIIVDTDSSSFEIINIDYRREFGKKGKSH